MQPRDIGITLAVAAVAGAGAAFGAVTLHRWMEAPQPDLASEIAKRFDRIETSIARTTEDAKAARADAAELKQRLASMETAFHDARAAAPGTSPEAVADPSRPGRARRPISLRSQDGGTLEFKVPAEEAVENPFVGGFQVLSDDDGAFEGLIGEQVQGELAKHMQGITNGFKLRSLPEDQRWAKAKEELGLNDTQVDALKQAVTARDESMKDAMKPLRTTAAHGGGQVTIRTMDPAKAQVADEGYRKKVNETLDENQRKSWDEKGYSHAFGKPGGGGMGISIIASDQVIETKSKDEK